MRSFTQLIVLLAVLVGGLTVVPVHADSAVFPPVGTGVSSARVGAVAVRTGAGLGADVRLGVPAPQNEVQPRSYRIEPVAPYLADTANTMTEQVLGDPRGANSASPSTCAIQCRKIHEVARSPSFIVTVAPFACLLGFYCFPLPTAIAEPAWACAAPKFEFGTKESIEKLVGCVVSGVSQASARTPVVRATVPCFPYLPSLP